MIWFDIYFIKWVKAAKCKIFIILQKTVVDLTASTSGDDSLSNSNDGKNVIYATAKFDNRQNIEWIEKKKVTDDFSNKNDSDHSNNFFSYPGKGRTKFRNTISNLNDAAILALYGDNFESEPILQIRVSALTRKLVSL